MAAFQTVDKPRILFFSGEEPHFVFSATGASKKLLVSENPLMKRVFKGTGVVLAGIECSPKIFDFRANGISVQESADFFDTLNCCRCRFYTAMAAFIYIRISSLYGVLLPFRYR